MLGRVWIHGRGEVHLGAGAVLDGRDVPVELHALEGGQLLVGAGARIGPGTSIEALESVEIGPGARLGAYCKVLDSNFHPVQGDRSGPVESRPVVVERGACVGPRAILLPGSRVAAGAVVAPGAVVPARGPAGSARAPAALRFGPTGLAGRLALAAWETATAALVLRGCARGRRVRAQGLVRVENRGEIRIGAHVRFQRGGVPTELVAGPGAALEIGERSIFNYGVVLEARRSVRIGARCMFGSFAHVCDGAGGAVAPIVIEDDVWLAHGAVVEPGVRIGRGAVVSAGSVVTRDVPEQTLAVGNPARCMALHPRPPASGGAVA